MKIAKIQESNFKKLIGKWITEGRILKTDSSPEISIKGSDSYEIILDGFFMLHKADVYIGSERNITHEYMAIDHFGGRAVLWHFNNQGSAGSMNATLNGGDLSIKGDSLRFDGQFSHDDNQLRGTWEKLNVQKKWEAFLVIKLTRSA